MLGRGDDDDHDIDIPALAGPIRRELLQAALILKKHVATLSDLFARKL
jgi:hypothetical protein